MTSIIHHNWNPNKTLILRKYLYSDYGMDTYTIYEKDIQTCLSLLNEYGYGCHLHRGEIMEKQTRKKFKKHLGVSFSICVPPDLVDGFSDEIYSLMR